MVMLTPDGERALLHSVHPSAQKMLPSPRLYLPMAISPQTLRRRLTTGIVKIIPAVARGEANGRAGSSGRVAAGLPQGLHARRGGDRAPGLGRREDGGQSRLRHEALRHLA